MKNYFWGITQSTQFCLARKSIFYKFSCDKNPRGIVNFTTNDVLRTHKVQK